ncbi:uncharacterized protein LOC121770309 [Salvia splendens]|uniref:uncharacterized protein LOC121770309 n=1 Tax=Salvia splendens TaxID=180675 RepID=UPI001C267E31|nr:uncharacterized protein LOC121770309 [Salvia splendens]
MEVITQKVIESANKMNHSKNNIETIHPCFKAGNYGSHNSKRRDGYPSFDVGTSRRDDEYHSFEFNTSGREVDEPLDVPNLTCDGYDGSNNCDGSDGSDNGDGADGSDNCDGADNVGGADDSDCDGSDGSQPSDLDYSAESCEDSTDDEALDMMVEKYVQPSVRGEQSVPNYVLEGLPFFRSLPCKGSRGYFSEDHGLVDEDMWYWDEDNPRHIDVGTKFDSKLQLKTAITLWHVGTGWMYEVMDSHSRRWHAVCRDPFGPKRIGRDLGQRYPCNWEVKATFKKRDGSWSINSWVDRHCCMGDHDPSEHHSSLLQYIHISNKFHVKISYKKAWYARRKAIELVYGGWEGSFRQLPSYLTELQTQNPGTIVEWLHDPVLSQGNTKVFRYVFWAFGPAIEAFQVAKPVLSVDGTHLRGRLKGKLLAAVGYDANKNCLPVAFAIVDEETNESWSWFLNLVRVHIIKHDQEVCIISDRHQGIINAMKADVWKEAPVGYHRFCLIHVRSNVLQRHKVPGVKKWVWIMGEVSEERRYWTARRELEKVSPEALRYLETTIDRSQWTMAHDEFRRWGETSTNMAECYNNVLLAARELPIRAIVDITFWRTINWFVNRTTLAKQCQTSLTPWAWELFQKNDQRGRRHHVRTTSIARGIYDVLTYHRGPGRGHNIHVVDYREKICSCGKWQTWRMPCSHAVAVLRERSDDIFSHVDTRYHTDVWIHQYADTKIIGMNLNGHSNVHQHGYFLVHVGDTTEGGYTTKWMSAKKMRQELLLDAAFVERPAIIEESAL